MILIGIHTIIRSHGAQTVLEEMNSRGLSTVIAHAHLFLES